MGLDCSGLEESGDGYCGAYLVCENLVLLGVCWIVNMVCADSNNMVHGDIWRSDFYCVLVIDEEVIDESFSL